MVLTKVLYLLHQEQGTTHLRVKQKDAVSVPFDLSLLSVSLLNLRSCRRAASGLSAPGSMGSVQNGSVLLESPGSPPLLHLVDLWDVLTQRSPFHCPAVFFHRYHFRMLTMWLTGSATSQREENKWEWISLIKYMCEHLMGRLKSINGVHVQTTVINPSLAYPHPD